MDLEEDVLAYAVGLACPAVAFAAHLYCEAAVAAVAAPRFKVGNHVFAIGDIVGTGAVVVVDHAAVVLAVPRWEVVDGDLALVDFGCAGEGVLAVAGHEGAAAHEAGQHLERGGVAVHRLVPLVDGGEVVHVEPVPLGECDVALFFVCYYRGYVDVGAPEVGVLAVGEHRLVGVGKVGRTCHGRTVAGVVVGAGVAVGDVGVA